MKFLHAGGFLFVVGWWGACVGSTSLVGVMIVAMIEGKSRAEEFWDKLKAQDSVFLCFFYMGGAIVVAP